MHTVQFVDPEASLAELEVLLGHAVQMTNAQRK
jgi:hypothetical protein